MKALGNITRIPRDTLPYPRAVRAFLGDDAPPELFALGDVSLLECGRTALLCSVRCPGSLILRTYDLARALRDAQVPTAVGVHSPMEREALDLLLRGPQPVVVCDARRLALDRVSPGWHKSVWEGRLLVLSASAAGLSCGGTESVPHPGGLVAALGRAVVAIHASPGGETEEVCGRALWRGKPVFVLEDPANSGLIALGAVPVGIEGIGAYCGMWCG